MNYLETVKILLILIFRITPNPEGSPKNQKSPFRVGVSFLILGTIPNFKKFI